MLSSVAAGCRLQCCAVADLGAGCDRFTDHGAAGTSRQNQGRSTKMAGDLCGHAAYVRDACTIHVQYCFSGDYIITRWPYPG